MIEAGESDVQIILSIKEGKISYYVDISKLLS